VSLVGQWSEIERGLSPGWGDARLRLVVSDPSKCDRAAALLGPAQPYRIEPRVLRFFTSRRGGAPGPDGIRRLLQTLDRDGIEGRLELVSSAAPDVKAVVAAPVLAEQWDSALERLPSDWSDIYAEVELVSTDWIERAALLMAPLNPRLEGGKPALRFRCAQSFGYGAAPVMVKRCLQRCDAEGIRGTARVLRVLVATDPVGTQGPVWYLAGRTV
jgi:hypothetical protein